MSGGGDLEIHGHVPVLGDEIVYWLQPKPHGCYVDCTLGLGGTARRILQACGPEAHLIAIDQDPHAIESAREALRPHFSNVSFCHGNFRDLSSILDTLGISQVDGFLFDLGISSAQLAEPDRGFSFQHEGPIDMRMDPSQSLTAGELVNTLPEEELANVIYEFGEERLSRRIARGIVRQRTLSPLRTTSELASVIQKSVPPAYRHGRLHPATRTFQALRIAVNNELAAITPALHNAVDRLVPGGRVCVISFHSLEDRLVKYTFRALSQPSQAKVKILTKKPCVASLEERKKNPRSRSAKLRVVEKISEGPAIQEKGHPQ
ncbi:16S rRNA (cytosine(1402)-N(4))-methyltransferase RsmH [Candidatus Nitronereus thalassa]|uniref:Ribosomal RNA small subunit methyltransferase H n=1 Tax=Candidatus Nitronereus thalassa TaxID=3020898 RepID=A0ABU3KA87_9BACT|nr:16S rRNA (cytosine(1402)-N(4))-methyltransferase RsmH [Candidatus Nitronereus thalassa]MDT7043335.1 16S rRNA (cytosine(1402)-N(4))-methyltransferase RsmH [Candidatus Nitronereus thalassa]